MFAYLPLYCTCNLPLIIFEWLRKLLYERTPCVKLNFISMMTKGFSYLNCTWVPLNIKELGYVIEPLDQVVLVTVKFPVCISKIDTFIWLVWDSSIIYSVQNSQFRFSSSYSPTHLKLTSIRKGSLDILMVPFCSLRSFMVP